MVAGLLSHLDAKFNIDDLIWNIEHFFNPQLPLESISFVDEEVPGLLADSRSLIVCIPYTQIGIID